MSEELKAKELIEKYYNGLTQQLMIKDAKQCALICCDEIIEGSIVSMEIRYWQAVKEPIKKY